MPNKTGTNTNYYDRTMNNITLEAFLHKSHTTKTANAYLYTIEHFLKMNPKAELYNYQQLVDYMAELSKRYPNAQTKTRILSAIKRYYDYLIHTDQRADHPCKSLIVKRERQNIQVQDLFTSEDLQRLMSRENRYKHLDIRNKVLLSLLIYQGLTSDEILRLEVKDIDTEYGSIYIKESAKLNRRTLRMERSQIILFNNYINQTREELLQCKTDKLILNKLGNPITTDGIKAVVEPLQPLFNQKKMNPKAIRMSVISNWLNEKKLPLEDVQQMAGHKWPSSTEKYIKADHIKQRELINQYFPL